MSISLVISVIVTLTTIFNKISANEIDKPTPTLIMDGFTWAENLIFDGKGNLFVSETVYSYLYYIYLCNNGAEYCKDIYLRGFDRIGGLAITPDGETIFIGVAFKDNTNGIIYTTTNIKSNLKGEYSLLANTANQPNGLQLNWPQNRLYYTYEGKPNKPSGIFTVDINTKIESIVYSPLMGADGLWFDELYQYLYVGALYSKKISVFDISNKDNIKLIQEFEGLHLTLNSLNIMDDFTLYNHTNINNINETLLIGTDWTGRCIYVFSLDGKYHQKVPITNNLTLFEPASVRWGKGKGYDMKSIYISESGGLTKFTTDRRIIQVNMDNFII